MSPTLAFALALFLFVTNDFLFWLASGSYAIYAVDYGVKLAMLALLLAAGVHRMADPPPQDAPGVAVFVLGFVFAAAANLVLILAAARLEQIVPPPHLFTWPRLDIPWLVAFDLTLGLALTAAVEELTARRLAWNVLQPRLSWAWGPLVVSSILFGLGHWGRGPWNIASATLGGMALFLVYRRTGSLTLVVAAHYFVDLLVFSEWYGVAWPALANFFR